MRLASVRADDVVQCDVRGQKFWAQVSERDGQQVEIMPLDQRVTNRVVTSRQIIGHWRKSRNGRSPS